jgi:hypothetical protein
VLTSFHRKGAKGARKPQKRESRAEESARLSLFEWLLPRENGGSGQELLFVGLVAFLKNLGVDVLGIRAATFGDVAGDIDEFAFFLAGRADLRWPHQIHGVSTVVAFPDRHLLNSFPYRYDEGPFLVP